MDLLTYLNNDPTWQNALNTMSNAQNTAPGLMAEQKRIQAVQQADQAERARRAQVGKAISSGKLTDDALAEIAAYDPDLYIDLLEQQRKQRDAEKRQEMISQYAQGATGGNGILDALAMEEAAKGNIGPLIQLQGQQQQATNQEIQQLNRKQDREDKLSKEQRDRDFELNQKPLTEADQRAFSLSNEGLEAAKALEDQLFDVDAKGNVKFKDSAKTLIAQITPVPGLGSLTITPDGNSAFSAAETLTKNNLYLKSGSAAPQAEVKGNMGIYAPSLTDDAESAYRKLQQSKKYFNERLDLVKSGKQATSDSGASAKSSGGWSIKRLD